MDQALLGAALNLGSLGQSESSTYATKITVELWGTEVGLEQIILEEKIKKVEGKEDKKTII